MGLAAASGASAYSAREAFDSELLRDEDILWYAQPDPSGRITWADLFLIPFGLFWTIFSIFWVAAVFVIAVTDEPAAFLGVAFGIPFVLVGLYMLFGRFWYKRWAKKRTYYAVTSRRILALSKIWSRSLHAAFIDTIPSIKKSIREDGSGTLWFGNTPWWVTMYGNTGLEFFGAMYGESPVVFYDIKEASEVYNLVNELRNR